MPDYEIYCVDLTEGDHMKWSIMCNITQQHTFYLQN